MKYRIEYESAKDGLVHKIDIEGNSDQDVLKKLVDKYKAEPSKILSCRRVEDSMKTYKIGNRTIKAESVEDALRVNKMLDSRVKDGARLIKTLGMPVAVEFNGKKYPIGDEPNRSDLASYRNELGLEQIATVTLEGQRYLIYGSGIGNIWHPKSVAVEDSNKICDVSYDSRLFHAGSDVRALCIKHDWYTGGTNAEYARMLQGANDGWTIAEIAKDIASHSHGVWSNDVAKELFKMAEEKSYLLKRDAVEDAFNIARGAIFKQKTDDKNPWYIKIVDVKDDTVYFQVLIPSKGVTSQTKEKPTKDFIRTLEGKGGDTPYGIPYKQVSSLHDETDIEDDDFLASLSEEEKQAIEDYRKAIAGTNDPKLLELYAHILREEVEHLDELQNAAEGDFVEDMEDIPAGYSPIVKTEKIITWKNAIKPEDLKMLIENYKKASEKDKNVLSERIKRYTQDVIDDYKADLSNKEVSRDEVERHYSSYKNVIEEINKHLRTSYRF